MPQVTDKLSQDVILGISQLRQESNSQTSVMISTDVIDRYKSNYCMILPTEATFRKFSCQDTCKFIFFSGRRVMVFNATFNNISVILWLSVLLVEETGVQMYPEKTTNLSEVTDKLYHIKLYEVHLVMSGIRTDNLRSFSDSEQM